MTRDTLQSIARNMTRHWRALGATLAAGAVAMQIIGAAHAATDTIFKYTTPKTGALTLLAAAFTPAQHTSSWSNIGSSLDGAGGSTCFFAAVNLPQGAKITNLAVWYAKNDSGGSYLFLTREQLSTGNTALIGSVLATDSGGARGGKQAAVTNTAVNTVNNLAYGYYLEKCVSSTETFYGARITFTYQTAGD
jgi:hypothetical protein